MTADVHALAGVRYVVYDVPAAIEFYTAHLGFTVSTAFPPAVADVVRGPLRLLLSGPAKRETLGRATRPGPAADMPVRAILARPGLVDVYWSP